MPSLKLIDKRSSEPHRHSKVFQTFGRIGIPVRKVHDGRGVFFAIVDEKALEEALKDENLETFRGEGFQPVPPIEYSSLKTIVVRNIDRMIDNYTDDEVVASIHNLNEWAVVDSIFRVPATSKIIKVRFQQQSMVNVALKKGVVILHQFIPATSIEKEIFIRLNFCKNCFSYDHLTRQCEEVKKPRCSFCSKEHYYTECRETEPKCVNCGGRHRTLAAACKIRKDIIKARTKTKRDASRSASRQRVYTSYAAAASAGSTGVGAGGVPGLGKTETKRIITKIMSAIIYSHYVEALKPGSFQTSIKQMYQLNGLDPVNFPTPPMADIVLEACREAFQTQGDMTGTQADKSDDLVFDIAEEEMVDDQTQLDQQQKRSSDTLTPPDRQEKKPKVMTDSFKSPPVPTKKTKTAKSPKTKQTTAPSVVSHRTTHILAQPQPQRLSKNRGREPEMKDISSREASSRESSLEVEGGARSRASSVSSTGIGAVDEETKQIMLKMKKNTRDCGITIYVAQSSQIDIKPEYFARYDLSQEVTKGNAKLTWRTVIWFA